MGNFREISDALLAAGVAREVANIADLTSEALSLLLDPAARAAMAAATRQWHTASQGAARRTCAAIKALL
jgi:3-deoxy-D-manno-octulosonic-acid transferase